MELSPEQMDQLAEKIAERIFAMQALPVITNSQAMAMVGKGTPRALSNWVRQYSPRAGCGQGRYSKEKILQGLRVEEKTGAKRRSGQHLRKKSP